MDDVLDFIAAGIRREYESPAENVSYESSEGGYQLPMSDTDSIFENIGLGESNENFYEDLRKAFAIGHWVPVDPYGMRPDDEMIFTWHAFSKQVMHQTRFTFFRTQTQHSSATGGDPSAEPCDTLEDIAVVAEDLGLFTRIEAGSRIVRARQHCPSENVDNVHDIASPPPEYATQNRFSPAGISMFYGADTIKTATEETVNLKNSAKSEITFGIFEVSRDLWVLDLTEAPEVPSLFDEDKASLRSRITFLREFLIQIQKPISRDGCEHFEYVPTQVVAEFFRRIFRLGAGASLDGICYKSSKPSGGRCFTLFFSSDDFALSAKPLILKDLKREKLNLKV